jgi:hypothetical protein
MVNTNENNNNINCDGMLEKASLYAENELSTNEKLDFENHLLNCEKCRIIVGEFLELNNILHDIESLEFPDELNNRISKSIENILPIKKVRGLNYKRWSAVAALFVIGFISVQMYNVMNIGLDNSLGQNQSLSTMQAPEMSGSSEQPPQNIASDKAVLKMAIPQPEYMTIINEKLKGYQFEVISDDIEKSVVVINIISDSAGKIINKHLVIKYTQNSITIDDNWLNIKL